ncbi:MAG: barstar family protein [Pseudomonadota bacterium]|nr:barstar family protein [Pseudomonadota bacterium]
MNGVFRISALPAQAMPILDGRLLGDKESLLAALGRELHFPDYYGGNWDALDECLADLSWHTGPLRLLITHADSLPDNLRESLVEVFLDAAKPWAEAGRIFALYLADSAAS